MRWLLWKCKNAERFVWGLCLRVEVGDGKYHKRVCVRVCVWETEREDGVYACFVYNVFIMLKWLQRMLEMSNRFISSNWERKKQD